MDQPPPSAFCSYSRTDAEFALKLAEDLKAAGANVWMDQIDIEPGAPWDRAVEEALAAASRILVILSPASVSSDNVSDELSFALSKHKRIIPVLYRECDVPFRLARLQHIDFTRDYDRGLKALIKTLSAPQGAGSSGPGASEDTNVVTTSEDLPEKPFQKVGFEKQKGKYPAWMKIGIALCIIMVAGALTLRWTLLRSSDQGSKEQGSSEQGSKTEQTNPPITQPSKRKPSSDQAGTETTKSPAAEKLVSNAGGESPNQMVSIADQFQLAASAKLISNEQETKRFAFALSIQAPDVLKRNIARVNYDLVYTSNPLALTSDDPSRNFEAVYDGWGRYQKVDVTVTFKNEDSPRKKTFNMCSVLGW